MWRANNGRKRTEIDGLVWIPDGPSANNNGGGGGGGGGMTGPTGPTGVIGPMGIDYSDYLFWDTTLIPPAWNIGNTEVHIGSNAGQISQSANAIAIGEVAGYDNQSANAIAIGHSAGYTGQGENAIAIGQFAGRTDQSTNAIAIGRLAGYTGQGERSIAIGQDAGQYDQGQSGLGDIINAIAIGYQAGQNRQRIGAIAIGQEAGRLDQSNYAIAIGTTSGNDSQGNNAIAMGVQAGDSSQSDYAIAIGKSAGKVDQGQGGPGGLTCAIAIGYEAGKTSQGESAIAIGLLAGRTDQSANAIAIGQFAGYDGQSANAIAIGQFAGETNQADNSIILNATGNTLDGATGSFYVAPIRSLSSYLTDNGTGITNSLYYNNLTKEIFYDPSFIGVCQYFLSGASITVIPGNIIPINTTIIHYRTSWQNSTIGGGGVQITQDGIYNFCYTLTNSNPAAVQVSLQVGSTIDSVYNILINYIMSSFNVLLQFTSTMPLPPNLYSTNSIVGLINTTIINQVTFINNKSAGVFSGVTSLVITKLS